MAIAGNQHSQATGGNDPIRPHDHHFAKLLAAVMSPMSMTFVVIGGGPSSRGWSIQSIILAPLASSSIGFWPNLRKGRSHRSHKMHVLRAARLSMPEPGHQNLMVVRTPIRKASPTTRFGLSGSGTLPPG
jgi:hypothetical protein